MKLCLICLLLISTILGRLSTDSATSLQFGNLSFPDDLYTRCPYSSFCGEGNVGQDQDVNDDNIVPCCSSCSCSEDCGRTRNCCKYEYDLYRIDETLGTVCKQLNTIPFNETPDEPFYHIIRSCLNRSHNCDSVQVNGWGSYFPVYSNETGMLYYNPACAECQGQLNITTFKRLINCPHLQDSYFASASQVKKGIRERDCELNFLPPAGLDLSTEICHHHRKQECKYKDFDEYETYDALCKSFNATFYTKFPSTYHNVYCFLCSSKYVLEKYSSQRAWINESRLCPTRRRPKKVIPTQFSIIFDTTVDTEADEGNDGRKWCVNVNNEVLCRRMLCPEGQIFGGRRCRQLGTAWYFKHAGMSIYLTPTPDSNKVTLIDMFPTEQKLSKYSLERPGFEDWNVTILYNVDKFNNVRYFVALLFHRTKNILPHQFTKKTVSSLHSEWKLHINERVFSLKPKINKYNNYMSPNNDSDYLPEWYGMNLIFGDTVEKYINRDRVQYLMGDRSILQAKNRIGVIYITKLFFCTLIELMSHDWDDWTVRIYLVEADIFLEDGEYTTSTDDNGNLQVRICLEDFQRTDAGNVFFESLKLLAYCMMAVIVLVY